MGLHTGTPLSSILMGQKMTAWHTFDLTVLTRVSSEEWKMNQTWVVDHSVYPLKPTMEKLLSFKQQNWHILLPSLFAFHWHVNPDAWFTLSSRQHEVRREQEWEGYIHLVSSCSFQKNVGKSYPNQRTRVSPWYWSYCHLHSHSVLEYHLFRPGKNC